MYRKINPRGIKYKLIDYVIEMSHFKIMIWNVLANIIPLEFRAFRCFNLNDFNIKISTKKIIQSLANCVYFIRIRSLQTNYIDNIEFEGFERDSLFSFCIAGFANKIYFSLTLLNFRLIYALCVCLLTVLCLFLKVYLSIRSHHTRTQKSR